VALPGANLRLVDPLAARVTKMGLLSFPDFMRLLRLLVFLPVWLVLTAEASPSPSATPAASPAPSPSPSSSPSPSPIPTNAFLSLDVTAGGPTTVINVIGGQFLANEQMTLYWDQPSKVAGTATADANGNFNARVKPVASDAPGVHRLCANVPPTPCANFTLQAAVASPSPSPTPDESPSPSPSAEPTPTQAATPARINATLSGFDVISKPPFVFLPIFGLGALFLALAYWAFSVIRRPRRLAPLPSAAVVHRATRPDYTASFGSAPPRPADAPSASAWSESMPHTPSQAAPPPPAPPAPPAPRAAGAFPASEPQTPAVQWGLGTPDSGYPELKPRDMRADDDWPEMPQPGD
jgi:hypothetical protein